MKIAVASDIHGSAYWCAKLVEHLERIRPDKLILLGDLMYHGPRNPLPEGYDPAEVANQLNALKMGIIAVRGNCDSEVDQMLLDFPCMADYALVGEGCAQLFCTHGHLDLDRIIEKLPVASAVSSDAKPNVDSTVNSKVAFNANSKAGSDVGSNASSEAGSDVNPAVSSVVLSGHTHVKCDDMRKGIRYLNPGSVSIPKDGSNSFLVYDGGNVEFICL